jgi:hypothetical protein
MTADVSTSSAWLMKMKMQCEYLGGEDGLFGALVQGESKPKAATAYGICERGFFESWSLYS